MGRLRAGGVNSTVFNVLTGSVNDVFCPQEESMMAALNDQTSLAEVFNNALGISQVGLNVKYLCYSISKTEMNQIISHKSFHWVLKRIDQITFKGQIFETNVCKVIIRVIFFNIDSLAILQLLG